MPYHKPSGAEGASAPPKLSVNVPFFADEPFKCALFERSNPKCTWKSVSKISSKLKHIKKKLVLCLVIVTFKEKVR